MKTLTTGFIFWVLTTTTILAEPTYKVDVTLPKTDLIAGEPLFAHLAIKYDGNLEKNNEIFTVSMNSLFGLVVELFDEKGNIVGKRPEEPWYPNGSGFSIAKTMGVGDVTEKTMIIHRWHSTWLEAGDYTLIVKVTSIMATPETEKRSTPRRISGLPKTFRFPITISKNDKGYVNDKFEEILNNVHKTPVTDQDKRNKRLAADTIIFAQGPIALPYQLELLEDLYTQGKEIELTESRLLEMFRCIAHSGDANTAKALVDFSNKVFFADCKSKSQSDGIRKATYIDKYGAWEYLVYAIYELHNTGVPEIMEITNPFVKVIPPSRGIKEFMYIDGGSGRQEDY